MKRSPALWVLLGLLLVGHSLAQGPQSQQPRVFLQATSHGNVWAARRDQSMEMAKDFQKNCPDVKVTILQTAADYTVILNHIEVGAFARDNQFQVANKEGDMLSGVREKGGIKSGSINGGVKAACNVILSDWQARQATPAAAPAADSTPAPAAPAPEPAPAADSTPAPAPAAPASAPTPAVYQQQDSVRVQTATQTTSEPNSQESLGDAARKAKQHKACLDLAKDNPSIICK
jgi:hypothetical protein